MLTPLAGAVLFSLGVVEARRLATGDDADIRRTAKQIGLTRAVAGSALLAKPGLLPTVLGSDAAKAPNSAWPIRMVAVREIVFGLGTAQASRGAQDARPWLLAVSLVDAGEALVLVNALRRQDVGLRPGLAFVAADAGSATAAAGLIARMRRTRSSG